MPIVSWRRLLPLTALVLAALGVALPTTSTAAVAGAGPPVVVTTDVAYGVAPDEAGVPETLRLDLYDPVDVPGTRPALVVVHGGGFERGDKSDPVYVAMAEAFAAQRLVVAVVNYRLRPDTYPDYPAASLDAQDDPSRAVREAWSSGAGGSAWVNAAFGLALIAVGFGVARRAGWAHRALTIARWGSIAVLLALARPTLAPFFAMAGGGESSPAALLVVAGVLLGAQIAAVLWFLRFWRKPEVREAFR